MKRENIFETLEATKARQKAEAGKRLEITVEIEKLLEKMAEETDPDSRASIEGEIRRLLERGRRAMEKDDVDDYYRRLNDVGKRVA